MIKEGDKQGISKITFRLIVILIIIIVFAVILIIIMEFIKSGSERIEFEKLNINLEISKFTIINDSSLNITVKRNPGSGELVGIGFIIESQNDSEIIQKNVSLNQLEIKTFPITLEKLKTSEITKVQISLTFKIESQEMKKIKNYAVLQELEKD